MRYIAFLIVLLIFMMPVLAASQGEKVVSLGEDLTDQQREQILGIFGVGEKDVKIIYVTNQEERIYLKGIADDEKIGTRAISSAYVEPLEDGRGIIVETYNIAWVTKEMYANAMATAGVENARVVAAAPFSVSGTAALTGIMKAFEEASGRELTEEAKRTANEELVTTGELGEDIGKDKAAALIKDIKERIVKERVRDPDEIRRIIIDIAAELDIRLSEEQIKQISDLMERISRLNLDVEKITEQLEGITKELDDIRRVVNENKGLIQRILAAIEGFIQWLRGLIG